MAIIIFVIIFYFFILYIFIEYYIYFYIEFYKLKNLDIFLKVITKALPLMLIKKKIKFFNDTRNFDIPSIKNV